MYDEFYLVIGNSELRVDMSSFSLYSNFGLRLRFFDTGADKLIDFLGEEKK